MRICFMGIEIMNGMIIPHDYPRYNPALSRYIPVDFCE
jgi:hypothetical protein